MVAATRYWVIHFLLFTLQPGLRVLGRLTLVSVTSFVRTSRSCLASMSVYMRTELADTAAIQT